MTHEGSVYAMQVGKAAQLVDAYANEGIAILERVLGFLITKRSMRILLPMTLTKR